jgi:flavin reductase (DIM6/NTAB) family NADH-FMN oxidoreductase RutF
MGVSDDDYKEALSKFASGVTIVTVSVQGTLHGMTASSFASVSLHPPLILVCLEKTSRTHSLVMESRAFAVNVLGERHQSIARVFSEHGLKPFDDLPHRRGQSNAPVLDDAIAWVDCVVYRIFDGGDHDIVLGEVVECGTRPSPPLVYWNRAYRSLSRAEDVIPDRDPPPP